MRNATVTSIAPTGTLSLIAETSSGIEPVFSLVYKNKMFFQDEGKSERKNLIYVDKYFENYAKKNGFYSENLMNKIAEAGGKLDNIAEIPQKAKKIFVTTHTIDYKYHVAMQAAAQEFVDAAVSKTINMTNDAKLSDVRSAYIKAWESKCKGITIYRDGCKSNQVLENVNNTTKQISTQNDIPEYKFPLHELSENAKEVLSKRALIKDINKNVIETPQELWHRIASFISSAETLPNREHYTKVFYDVMNSGLFYCGGALIWAGMGKKTVLSKCLVLPISDSIDSIFNTLNWNVQCLRRGVGTGINFSSIRSSYSKVSTTDEFAAGPIKYLKIFNQAQGSITGRGGREMGTMAILNADHPNIEEFIESKDDLVSMNHYNISVGASDKFMKAVKEDSDWNLVDPSDGQIKKTIKAKYLFEKIAKHAWLSGDPGMYFMDRAEKDNTTPHLGKMDATNPCGEQPLIPFETCNMGHINLTKFVKGFPLIDESEIEDLGVEKKLNFIDWDLLKYVISIGVRFLDDIIDINNYPFSEIEEMTKKTRNIGLGIMGFADLLVKLGVEYGSDESMEIAENLMHFINKNAHEASEKLGIEKGSFPSFNESVYKNVKKAMRNTRVTTIAPTGTISIIGACNPGIEPIFGLRFVRTNSMGGKKQEVFDPLLLQVASKYNFDNPEFFTEISAGKSLSELSNKFKIPNLIIKVFKTAHSIDSKSQVNLQAVFQKNIDSAVSKTINLRKSATWEEIAKIYILAYNLKCKGITVFREGSKDSTMLIEGSSKDTKSEPNDNISLSKNEMPRNVLEPRPRKEFVVGRTYEVKTEQGDLYVTINSDEKGIVEVFLTIGKSGSFTAGYTEALGRLISMSLRSGIKAQSIVKQLQGIRTSSPTLNKGMIVYSVPDAIAKIIKKFLEEQASQISMIKNTPTLLEVSEPDVKITETIKEIPQISPPIKQEILITPKKDKYSKNNFFGNLLECPECGNDLEYSEGCILCRACGFSKCG